MSLTGLATRVGRLEQCVDATHGFPPWTAKQWHQWHDRQRVEALCALPNLGDDLTHASAVLKACAADLSDMGLRFLISTLQTARGDTP
jgi:hypothetical protein